MENVRKMVSIFPSYLYLGNKLFVEITEQAVPGVMPGQYISEDGIIYDSNYNHYRYPTESRYFFVYVILANGERLHTNLHRIIMLVYKYQQGCENLVVNHIDGDKHNNTFENLEWCTQTENNRHAFRTGLNTNVEENHHQAKLTNAQVEEICKELEKPRFYGQMEDLAKKYGVTERCIKSIASGENWQNISAKYNIDYSQKGVESILTEKDVIEICEELSKSRKHGQCVELGKKYNVSPSTIKEIVQRRSWTNISCNYEFPSKINNALTSEQIEQICSIIEEFGYYDMDVFDVIQARMNLEPTKQLKHNIRRLYRRDPHCYYDITSKYNW